MRFKCMTTAVLAAMIAAGASFAQVSGSSQESEPCRLLVAVIERQLEALDNSMDRLSDGTRLATEQDRERIIEARERYLASKDYIRQGYERIISEVDLTCDECVTRACLAMRPRLVEVRDKLTVLLQDLVREESAMRIKIAGAKRVALAIRATDRALVRAAQIARKTGNGTESFPGLRRAFELEENAKQALAAGRLEASMKITLKARDMIGETMRAALDSADVEAVRQRAADYKDATSEMIARIERNIDKDANQKIARLVDMAKKEQAKAQEMAEESPYQALRHAQAARRIVSEILQFGQRAKNCESRGEMLASRIEEAQEAVESSGNEKAVDILQSGIRHYDNGKELCENGNSAQATVQFDITLKLVTKSVDIARGETRKDLILKREISKTMIIVKKAESVSETEQQKSRVETARQLVQKAGDQTDNPEACLKLLDKATDIAFSVISESKRSDEVPAGDVQE
jgi:tetratricopeptide (TPR) repeat protein